MRNFAGKEEVKAYLCIYRIFGVYAQGNANQQERSRRQEV